MTDIFLKGSTIDLTIPEESDLNTWYGWFNDQKITEFLEQGRFPNTKEKQLEFMKSSESQGRLILMIKNKSNLLLGTISLSLINNIRKSCDISYVCPVKSEEAPFSAIEALALCSEHAFERLGIKLIYAGHSWPGLDKWFIKTELLGYRIVGFNFNGFRHGSTVTHSIRTCLTFERYRKLKESRSGKFFPGNNIFSKNYLKYKNKKSSAYLLKEFLEENYANRDSLLRMQN